MSQTPVRLLVDRAIKSLKANNEETGQESKVGKRRSDKETKSELNGGKWAPKGRQRGLPCFGPFP